MPDFSVVIPAFNRAHCLSRALESVRIQGFPSVEVVLGDDASTDDTIAVARREWPGIKIAALKRNSGAAAARNAALRMATGEWIAFLDSDDEWLPGKIAAQFEAVERDPRVAYCATSHVYALRDGRRREVRVHDRGDWEARLQECQPSHGASTPLVRRSILDRVGLQDERLRVLEDWDWALRIARTHQVSVLEEPFAVVHENAPSNPDATLASTRIFLEKHRSDLLRAGAARERRVRAQHWENAGRCLIRHGRPLEGCRWLWSSLVAHPARNPAMLAAFPIAAVDALCGTRIPRKIMAARGGYSIL